MNKQKQVLVNVRNSSFFLIAGLTLAVFPCSASDLQNVTRIELYLLSVDRKKFSSFWKVRSPTMIKSCNAAAIWKKVICCKVSISFLGLMNGPDTFCKSSTELSVAYTV